MALYPPETPDKSYGGHDAVKAVLPLGKIAPPNNPEATSGPHVVVKASRNAFDNIASHDNARVHLGDAYGDQHNHYYGGPTSRPTVNQADSGSLMDALYFDHMDFRSSTIAEAYSKTCQWLFDTSQYTRWRDRNLLSEHSGFLWIKGKPGAGKSTIMKHASNRAKTAYKDEMTVKFFFNARGATLGKSIEGMYRCLLYQMADHVPQLPSMVKEELRKSYASSGWPIAMLKALFKEAACYLSRKTRLSFYIDALDEGNNEDQVRDMADFLCETAERAISEGNAFYVCLASRHYPKISVRLSEELRLEDHSSHDDDIATYIQKKLRLGNIQLEQELTTEMRRKSSGIFLWVVLVVAILNKEGDRGNQHLLRAQLQRIPTGLFDLLEDIRQQDASDERFLPAIRWVLFARRPLKAEELYFAVLASTGHLTAEAVIWEPKVVDARVISDFILSSSKGLLEIGGGSFVQKVDVKGSPRAATTSLIIAGLGGNVQFIHEVVREYFLKHGLTRSTLDPKSLESPVATNHLFLSRSCLNYVRLAYNSTSTRRFDNPPDPGPEATLTRIIKKLLPKLPLLDYSLKQALQHADLATGLGTRVVGLAENFPWDAWIFFRSTITHRCMYTWLHLITYEGHAELIKEELTLLESNTKRSRRGRREFQSMLDARSEGLGSALHIAATQKALSSSLELLLAKGADVNATCIYIGTPLHSAVRSSNLKAARYLLEKGADPNASCRRFGNVLDCAVRSSTELLKLLLRHGANANAQRQGINTAMRAVPCGDIDDSLRDMRLLLTNGADANSAIRPGTSYLHVAIIQRSVKMVKVLVQGGADLDRRIGEYGNAVQTAGRTNDWRIMQALANCSADINPEDFSSSGPYSDPWIARANREALSDSEVSEAMMALSIPTTKYISRSAPTRSVSVFQTILASWRRWR